MQLRKIGFLPPSVDSQVPYVVMAMQKNAFLDIKEPAVLLIWRLLEKGIPADYMEEMNYIPSARCQKSATEAAMLRQLGNQFYTSRNFDGAMMYYSKCVAFAPADSEELALAYANRSGIFQYRKEFDLCLLDVNRALDGSLPQKTRQMLLQRKAVVWEKLQEQNDLKLKLRDGISGIKRGNVERANLIACARKLCYIGQVDIDDVDLMIDRSLVDDPIWNTKFDSTELENISSKIELICDDPVGPYLVAKDDIEPGEALCTDELYAFSLHEHLKLKYCNYCRLRCEALIPCSHCTREMYCSAGCREKAYDSYHRIECQILPLWVDIDDCKREMHVLVLRIFLRVTKQGSELANLLNSPVVYEALDGKLNCASVQFSPENYPMLTNVVSRLRYSHYESMTCYKIILRETLAVFAGLRFIQFFGNEDRITQFSGNILNEQEYFGAMLLVYQVSCMGAQSFQLTDSVIESLAEPLIVKNESIGRGFYLLRSFTLDSCDPNARIIVNRRNVLMYSVRSIKAGQQICPLGLAYFMQSHREARQKVYEEFCCPKCTCRACVENWPSRTELEESADKFRVRDKKMKLKIERMRKGLVKKQTSSISEDDLKTVLEFSRTIREYVKEPSAIIYKCETYIEKVMMSKEDVRVDPKYVASLYKDL